MSSRAPSTPFARSKMGAILIFTLLTGGVLLAILFPAERGMKPELLQENVSEPQAWAVRNGELFTARDNGQNIVIAATPLRGGKERVVYSTPSKGTPITFVKVSPLEFRFLVPDPSPETRKRVDDTIARPMAPSGGGFGGSFPGGRIVFDRNFLPPSKASDAPVAVKREFQPLPAPRTYRETLHRVPLNGDPPRTQYFVWSGVHQHYYFEDAVYYLRSQASGYTQVLLSNKGSYNEYPATASLYMRPLAGGKDRLIMEGVAVETGILADESGLTLRTLRPYPNLPYELIHLPPRGGKAVRIADYRTAIFPVRFQERLWWLEWEWVAGALTPREKLISIRPDGSDRQSTVLDTDPDGKLISSERLFVYRERLYILYRREDDFAPQPGVPAGKYPRPYIAPLQSNLSSPLGKPFLLPYLLSFQEAACDGDYCYYFTSEKRTDPLDFLKEKSTEHNIVVFHRVRMPE